MSDKLALSICEFCKLHSLSRAKFYLLVNEGKAPLLMRVGRRVLISIESAEQWRRQMEVTLDGRIVNSEEL